MGHFQILESARICVLEYKRKPIEMTEFQWVLRNYRIDSGATRNRTGLPLCETVAKPLSLRGKPVIIKGANLCSPFFVISGRSEIGRAHV